ncbi:hypothetical protein L798_11684 [Zootermopsis nevadensis]|uniref:Uncharacterized protein n=1 Tax=Zootermopsis nevadensis TaxID=136037 RepID=A0A067R6V6_ZOONE|nr:hypothetical protein L798_11684 [Zootermopsis nevadensis]
MNAIQSSRATENTLLLSSSAKQNISNKNSSRLQSPEATDFVNLHSITYRQSPRSLHTANPRHLSVKNTYYNQHVSPISSSLAISKESRTPIITVRGTKRVTLLPGTNLPETETSAKA